MNLQTFLADSTIQAVQDLETALMNLPQERWLWSAGGDARAALDMVAEVAILNGETADIIRTRTGIADFNLEEHKRQKAALYADWPALKTLLEQNTAKVAESIRAVPDDELSTSVAMPWGPMPMTQIISYPYWNAKYHEGQINFIASMLGCLK